MNVSVIMQWFSAGKKYAIAHKFISVCIALLLLGGGWWAYSKATAASAEIHYVLGTVEKGTVVSSISASGQVSASNQTDVTSKSSGDIVYLNAKSGQKVTAGTLIAQIDTGDAPYELETAKLSYEKLITVDPDALRNAQNTLTQAEEDLADAYTNARTSLTSASTGMADVMKSLKDFFNCNTGYLSGCKGYSQDDTKKQYQYNAESSWDKADALLYKLSEKYQSISKTSTREEIESVVADANETAVAVAEAAKYTQDAVVYFRNQATDSGSGQKEADAAYALVTPLVSSANSIVSNLTTTKSSITSTNRALENATYALGNVTKGPATLDIRSSELSIRQKQEALANYYIYAPFDGIIAAVAAKKGQNINSGATIATLITKQKIAELSLNEVDAAKIKIGDKATLTFDAIDSLSLTGSVAEINTIGAVTQGVVSYTIKIAFDSQDERVKPGMTVNAAIITDAHQDVLIVPASAVKQQNGASYVQVFDPPLVDTGGNQGNVSSTPPQQVEVVVGISDDTNTEITSGLTLGQQVVARTISGTTATAVSTAPSLFGAVGGTRTGTGAVRTTTGR